MLSEKYTKWRFNLTHAALYQSIEQKSLVLYDNLRDYGVACWRLKRRFRQTLSSVWYLTTTGGEYVT
jgi:hypothetical protein